VSGFHCCRHQTLSGIRNQGRPRVGHKGDRLVSFKGIEDGLNPTRLIMGVERGRALRDIEMIQEHASPPGVLGEHPIGLAKNTQCPQRHVFEVTDRCRDDVKRSHPVP
jgi:hypothetical protein